MSSRNHLTRLFVIMMIVSMLVTGSGIGALAESGRQSAAGSTGTEAVSDGSDGAEAADAAGSQSKAKSGSDAEDADTAKAKSGSDAEDADTAKAKAEATGDADTAKAKAEATDEADDAQDAGDAASAEGTEASAGAIKDWEATLPENIPEDIRAAVVEVAKSQLGYKESTDDFIENKDGTVSAWTRYSAFMKEEYADPWDTDFVMFALHYAGALDVDEPAIPLDTDAAGWAKALKSEDLLNKTEDGAPEKGDVVFYDSEEYGMQTAILLAASGDKYILAGAQDKKGVGEVARFRLNAEDIKGYVSLADIASATKAAASADEKAAADSDAENKDAEAADSEAADAEADAENAESTDADAAEETTDANGVILANQTLEAELVSAPGIGGKLKSLFTSTKNTKITLTGKMPENATVKAYPVSVEVPGQNVVTAYDITIYIPELDENGEPTGSETVWQPEEALSVSIKDDKLNREAKKNGDSGFNVFHMQDQDSHAELVAEADVTDNVTFDANAFSIYIVAKDAITKTYTFMNGDAVYSKQVLEDNDVLTEPTAPVKDGAVFDHWSLEEGGATPFTGFGEVSVSEDDHGDVTLYAVYGDDKVYITYYDQDGAVVQKDAIVRPTGDETATEDTTGVLYSPKQTKGDVFLNFRYWTIGAANLAKPNPPQAGTDGIITIDKDSKDIDLYPVVAEGHWIYFDSNKSSIGGDSVSVSYVEPLFVDNGTADDTSITAAAASTPGYTFKGWYTRKNNGTQIFDENGNQTENYRDILDHDHNLANNRTLYAQWEPEESVTYTVVFWRQKITDDKDATDDNKDYDYAESDTRSAVPGEVVYSTNDDTTKDGSGDYRGFHYNAANSETSVKVKGDGSSVINVYYDRDLIRFDYITRTFTKVTNPNTNKHYYDVNGNIMVYYNRYRSWYRLSYGQSYAHSRTVLYTRSGSTYTRATSYNYGTTYYVKVHSDTANYRWESLTAVSANNNNCYELNDSTTTYTGLYGQTLEQCGYSWPGGAWNNPNNDSLNMNYVITPVSEFVRNITAVTTDANADTIDVQYYFQKTDGTEDTDYTREPDAHAAYRKNLIDYTSNYVNLFTGMKAVKYKIGDAEWKAISAQSEQIYLNADTKVYYERDIEQLAFYDAQAADPSNRTVAVEDVLYGASLSSYASVRPIEQRDGYIFTGWYYDEDQNAPVDFENDTMPAANKRIYAGWEKIRFKVDIDPNGGEIGMPVNDHSTYFNVDYGETVAEYTDITRDYEKGTGSDIRYEYKYFSRESDPNEDPDVDQNQGANWRRTALYKESSSGEYIYKKGVYTFQGWFKVLDNGKTEKKPYNFTKAVSSDLKLRALWRRTSSYTIVYDAGTDGGEPVRAPIDDNEYIEGAHATVAASVTEPEGKRFIGWKVTSGTANDTKIYKPNDLLEISEDRAVEQSDDSMLITLTAQYEPRSLSDGYMADYVFMVGETEHYKQTIASGETLVQPPDPQPTETDTYFAGWYLDREGKHRFDSFGKINYPVYTTLYARFEKVHTVTYYTADEDGKKGDTIITTQTYGDGDYFNSLYVDCPVDDDHSVLYWRDANNQYPYKAVSDTIEVTENLDLWPVLSAHGLLRFDTQTDKCSVDPVKIPSQGWPTLPTEPVRPGYVFDGWWTEPGNESGYEYEFNMSLDEFKEANGLGYDVRLLYAHWKVDQTNQQKGKLTVMWYAQLPSGGHGDDDYELVNTKSISLNIGTDEDYTLDTASDNPAIQAKAASNIAQLNDLCGGDIYDVLRLKSLYSGDSARYDQHYMDAYFEKSSYMVGEGESSRPLNPLSFSVDDTGESTLKIYFDRKVYRYRFDLTKYSDGNYDKHDANPNNSIKVGNTDEKYTGNQYYIDVWLEKDVRKTWPIGEGTRSSTTDEVWVDWYQPSGETRNFGGWDYKDFRKSFLTAIHFISEEQIQTFRDRNANELTLCTSGILNTTPATLVYHFDGVIDHRYDEEVYITTEGVSTGRNNYVIENDKTFYKNISAKPFDGYTVISDPSKGDYCYYAGSTKYRGEYKTYTGGMVPEDYTVYKYRIADEWKNTTFYNSVEEHLFIPDEGDGRLYFADTLNAHAANHVLKNGTTVSDYTEVENDFVVTIDSPSGTRKTNGKVYYYNRSSRKFESMTWNRFTTEVIQHDTETAARQVRKTGTTINFYYESDSYPVYLIGYDGVTQIGTKNEKYKTQMSGSSGRLSTADYTSLEPTPDSDKLFECWSTSPDKSEPYEGTMPAHALTLYARQKVKTVHVTTHGYDFDSQRTDESNEYAVYSKDIGTAFKDFNITPPSEEGKNFYGWYLMQDGQKTDQFVSANDNIMNDITIYPRFESVTVVKLKYDRNGESGTGIGSVSGELPIDARSYVEGADVSIQNGAGLSKKMKDLDGKEYNAPFVSWNTKADGSGITYYGGDWINIDSHDGEVIDGARVVTLYAQYGNYRESMLTYKVNADGDKNAIFVSDVEKGADGEPTSSATVQNIAKERVKTSPEDTEGTVDEDTVILKFKDSTKDNDTETQGIPNTKVTVGEDRNKNKFTAIRPGYTFRGWATTPAAAEPQAQNGDFAYVNKLRDTTEGANTLYALWHQDKAAVDAHQLKGGVPQARDDERSKAFTLNSTGTWSSQEFATTYLNQIGKTLPPGNSLAYVTVNGVKIKKIRYSEIKIGNDIVGYHWQYSIKDDPGATDWTTFNINERPVSDGSASFEAAIKIFYQKAYELTVKNTITGEYADMTRSFEVTVTIAKADGSEIEDAELPGVTITGAVSGEGSGVGSENTSGIVLADDGKSASVKAKLNHNGSIVIQQLPEGWLYSVTEGEHDHYTLTYATGSEAATSTAPTNVELAAATIVTLTNTFAGNVVPSGIAGHSSLILIAVMILGAAGFASFYVMRRRRYRAH